jgi:hypothetical protein
MPDILPFPKGAATRRSCASKPTDNVSGAVVVPITSLPLVVRGLPPALRPKAVALDLLGPGSNEAALPIWRARKDAFTDHLTRHGITGQAVADLVEGWRALVRAEGIAEKARRRAAEDAVFRMFERMAAGLDPTGGDRA